MEQELTLMNRILGQGTAVEVTTITEDGPVISKGKIKGIVDMPGKKYRIHLKNTETTIDVQDVKVDNPEELKPPFQYISGAYDKYGREIV